MFVDDANGGFLRADAHTLDVVRGFTERVELRVDDVRCLDGGLRVEFGWVGNLEENVLHDVGAKRHLELERLALIERISPSERDSEAPKRKLYLEQDVVKAPGLGRQYGRETEFALFDE